MDLTTALAAIVMAVGLAGLVVPVLPGMALVLGGVLVWALGHSSPEAWWTFVAACVVAALTYTVQYLVPGRRLGRAGVPRMSTWFGFACAVVGFFVIPVVGLALGFVLGVLVAEFVRLRRWDAAWSATKVAAKAALVSVWIELLGAFVITCGWACVAYAIGR